MKRSQKHWYSRREKRGRDYRNMRLRLRFSAFLESVHPSLLISPNRIRDAARAQHEGWKKMLACESVERSFYGPE